MSYSQGIIVDYLDLVATIIGANQGNTSGNAVRL